ncbi:MAG TPA: divalent-cation tolerance protein CutA [Patescibacteria group bacterium]|nr:divalent-cation tolerance protein CutA [Patescibacteria group bacterium]
MKAGDFIVIYVTCANVAEAEKISTALLDEKLIACANVFAPHTAHYSWKGKREKGSEVAVIMKTRAVLFEKVRAGILKMHSYECPCIVAWPLGAAHGPFLDWIETETDSTGG